MNAFKADEVIFLLGAGASVDAKIPHSAAMIRELEAHIYSDKKEWSKFKSLYNYVRSAIYYSDGIHGRFDGSASYNIERLVDTLNEINRKSEHTLYPFVGAWNPTLVEVAGEDFGMIEEFKQQIVRTLLSEWMAVTSYATNANYYSGLIEFQKEYQYPLRLFTLNYDLCVERIFRNANASIERGFDDRRYWDWRRFGDHDHLPVDAYLYKLHGSVDWVYEDERLTYHDDPRQNPDTAIIFGTSYKLEYRDPFLFLTYEFRKWTLEARMIVVIGYGFGDSHINKIIQQALTANSDRVLLVVSPLFGEEAENYRKKVASSLEYRSGEQIVISDYKAADFMVNHLNLDFLISHLKSEDDNLFPVISGK